MKDCKRDLRDNTYGNPIRWNERAIVMEAATYRLAALGSESMDAVHCLIESEDPWLQVNAAFVAGEIADGESDRITVWLSCSIPTPSWFVKRLMRSLYEIERSLQHFATLKNWLRTNYRAGEVRKFGEAECWDQIDMNIAMFA